MLVNDDLILHEEMGDVIVQIHFFWDCIDSYCLSSAFYRVAKVFWRRVEDGIADVSLDLVTVEGLHEERLDLCDILHSWSANWKLFEKERILMEDIKTMLEGGILFPRNLNEIFD